MPTEVLHHPKENMLETIYVGKVSPADVTAVAYKNLSLARKHKVHIFLADASQLVDEKELMVENYDFANLLVKLFSRSFTKVRVGLVLPHDEIARGNLLFFETVARNRFLNVHVVETRDDALAWLFPIGDEQKD